MRRRADRAAAHYARHAVLAREVAGRMAERLQFVKLAPQALLDLGCGTGGDLQTLAARYPKATRVGLDLSAAMLARIGRGGWLGRLLGAPAASLPVCGDAASLPFANAGFDLLWSNLLLQWIADPLGVLREAQRVLRNDGLIMFSSFGPDTLRELRAAFRALDAAPHVLPFPDMHDLGDMLVAAGFADPVMDMEMITLTYPEPQAVFDDLRQAASGNALAGRRRGLTGRDAWQRMLAALEATRRDGRVALSFEVVYGHAWKLPARHSADGRAVVRFDRQARAR